jgi:hypothetical protein
VRLDPAEVVELPLAAALVDQEGRRLAATPEWLGPGPGSVVYQLGRAHLLVAPEVPTPELDALVELLLRTMKEASQAVTGEQSMRIEVLAAGLELVAGRPASASTGGPAGHVLELAAAAIGARTGGLAVDLEEPAAELLAPAPAALALALTQMAVNAHQHEGATSVRLRVTHGPTFYVEWADPSQRTVRMSAHRHPLRRDRWGWGYVQMVADALGATALPPAPTAPGMVGACLGLGSFQLTLPLALLRNGRVERSTMSWDQDAGAPRLGEAPAGTLAGLLEAAAGQPGRIAYRDLYQARWVGDHAWLVLAPESGTSRARDLVRGLAHERALWDAPEPLATRLQGLTALLGAALGEGWPSVPPSVWTESAPAAGRALGVALPADLDVLVLPDPRLVAVLLSELDGTLQVRSGQLHVQPSPARAACTWLAALGGSAAHGIHVNP